MATERIIPGEIRIFLNHIYEFKKGVRNMVLYTMSREHEEFAIRRLKNQKISYICLLYTSPRQRDSSSSRIPSFACKKPLLF